MSENGHKGRCKICNSLVCKDIERDWCNWYPYSEIVERYSDSIEDFNRQNIIRHMDAFPELAERRMKNVQHAFIRVMDRGLNGINPEDIDIDAIRKFGESVMEAQGQLKQGSNSTPAPPPVGIVIQIGQDKLNMGAGRFGFELKPVANTMPVARETLSIDQSANSTLIEGEYTIDPDPPGGPPPNESDVRDVKTQTHLSADKISGEK